MHSKKHLSLESLVDGFRKILDNFEDYRGKNVDYLLRDIVISGFAWMFFQEPWLLQFQKTSSSFKSLFLTRMVLSRPIFALPG